MKSVKKTKMFPTPFHGKKWTKIVESNKILVVIVRDEILPPFPRIPKSSYYLPFGNIFLGGSSPKKMTFGELPT